MKKKIAVLGATGSIGGSTIDVIRGSRDYCEPVLFSARSNCKPLLPLAREFPAAAFAFEGIAPDAVPDDFNKNRLFCGKDAVVRALEAIRPDVVVNGISGSAGLLPSLKTVELGGGLALANKESVVMAWELLKTTAAMHGAEIVPVDSECSAVFHLVMRHGKENLTGIVLTASGGPFRTWTLEQMRHIRIEDALNHPTWKMGPKITLDSASLANKGLEVIQISKIIDVPADMIQVSIHPQSVVHSMIQVSDGAVYAALSNPDMRLPIHQALAYPAVRASDWGKMNFNMDSAAPLSLAFERPDMEKFPMLRLAYQAAKTGGFYPLCYNAANEAAAERFICGDISFLDIPKIVETVLNKDWSAPPEDAKNIAAILEADANARRYALEKR
ncbi:MAG: 1-deoxy-D-xylulose-5-phosphate reductoisomerase [Spirochaetaceae bacterium]|nr:1-deoxy-D-xylulose-5-phosphate reductoisomerase [Spirochaetaceae bacterium]